MRFGLNLGNGGPAADPRTMADLATLAEQAQEVTLLPRPVQRPRIPIWIGGQYPKPGPVRRAARWDGSCLFVPTRYAAGGISQRDWTPDEVRAFLAAVAEVRPDGLAGFDMVVGGRARQADWGAERALIAALAGAGATWWNEWIKPAGRHTTAAAMSVEERGATWRFAVAGRARHDRRPGYRAFWMDA